MHGIIKSYQRVTITYSNGDLLDPGFECNKICKDYSAAGEWKGDDNTNSHEDDRTVARFQWYSIIENNRAIIDCYYHDHVQMIYSKLLMFMLRIFLVYLLLLELNIIL